MGVFDEILKKVEDPDIRQQFEELVAKAPVVTKEIEGGFLRQSDYSRQLDELGDVRDRVQRANQWDAWREANYDVTENKTIQQIGVEKELQKAREELEQLRAGSAGGDEDMTRFSDFGGDADPAAIAAIVKKTIAGMNLVSRADVESLSPAGEIDKKLNTFGYNAENFLAKVVTLADKHREEFGKPLDMDQFMAAIREKRKPPQDLYPEFVAEQREERRKQQEEQREKEVQEKIAAAREEGAQKARSEIAMSPDGRVPVDVGESDGGALTRMLRAQETTQKESQTDIKQKRLGSGIIAREAAIEYARKQAGSQG